MSQHTTTRSSHSASSPDSDLHALANRFHHFADHRAGTYAPLYAHLARGIATSPRLLRLAATSREGQSQPDLLLAAVHNLLMQAPQDPLAAY